MNTDSYRDALWKYLEKNHPGARVAHKEHGRSPWVYSTVSTIEQLSRPQTWFNHREVLPEELIADYDCPEKELFDNAMLLVEKLKEENINFSAWRTNGEENGGVHIHALWDIPETVKDVKLLKKLLLEYYVGSLENAKLDTQVLGKHLIRCEAGEYDKLPSWQAKRKTLIGYNGNPLEKNKVPQKVWDEYCSKILRAKLANLRMGRKISSSGATPNSINFILSPNFKEYRDGGKRALFILSSYYHHLPNQELYDLLSEFSKYNCRTPQEDYVIKQMVKRTKNHKGRRVGESYRKDFLRSIGAYSEVYKDEDK